MAVEKLQATQMLHCCGQMGLIRADASMAATCRAYEAVFDEWQRLEEHLNSINCVRRENTAPEGF